MSMISSLLKKLVNASGYTLMKTDFFKKYYHNNTNPNFRRSGNLEPLEQLVYKYLHDDFFFIQIGANNGERYDPIHDLIVREKQFIKGIAIEPVSEYFEELKQTYKDYSAIKLLRTAIHNENKEALIYKIDTSLSGIEEHLKGMSSFDITNFTKEGIPAEKIVTEKVPCISIMELIKQNNISKVHLLQIDAEGYDLEIIKSIDFKVLKPKVINFEHRWQYDLINDAELFKVFRTLIDNGYQIVLNGNDALAYLD